VLTINHKPYDVGLAEFAAAGAALLRPETSAEAFTETSAKTSSMSSSGPALHFVVRGVRRLWLTRVWVL